MDIKASLAYILGKKIRESRVEIDMKQDELAEKIQLTRTSISNIEAGRQLAPLDVLYKICHTLGKELHFLLPTYTEVQQSSVKNETISDKLKTNNVSESSIEVVQKIINNHKRS